MNHPCGDWNKSMLPIIQNTSFNSRAWWLPLVNERFIINELVTSMLPVIQNTFFNSCAWWLCLVNERFIINKLVTISMVFFWTWCNEWCCRVQLNPSNRGWWFFEWGLFLRQAHHYWNQFRKWVSATCRLEWGYQSSKKIMACSLSYIETQWFFFWVDT